MSTDVRFRANSGLVASKVYEDEAVLINTATGRYYDLEGAGSAVWDLLGEPRSAVELGQALAARFDVDGERAEADCRVLLEELAEEELVVAERNAPGPAVPDEPTGERKPYAAPQLTSFTDMEELLAADPPLPSAYTPVWEAPQSKEG